ncbi:hypothetical protein ACHAWX_005866 [Stephanocyclus meneghinianus]
MRRLDCILYFLLAHNVMYIESFALDGLILGFRRDFSSSSIHRGLRRQVLNADSVDSNGATVAPADMSTQFVKHRRERIPILSYEDNHVIVSKPAGVSMHRNFPRWGHAAKSPGLEKLVQKQLSRKPYLVHRLDHRTSGAVIMGFDSQTAAMLHGKLRDEEAVKLYLALVRGDLRERFETAGRSVSGEALSDILPKTIDDATNSTGRKRLAKITVNLPIDVHGVQKEAKTDFYFLSSIDLNGHSADETIKQEKIPFTNKALTLLLCQPTTGRTHQIRRHLRKALNSPIIGDSEHGDSRVNRFWRETIGLDRLGLHCWYIELPPRNKDYHIKPNKSSDDVLIQCIAPLPDDFTNALRHGKLKQLWEEALQAEPRLSLEPVDERGCTFGRHYRHKSNNSRQ